jgi:tellurite resistance protein TehA-like permease
MDPVTGGVIVATVVTFGVGFVIGVAVGCIIGAYAIYLYLRDRRDNGPVIAPGT